MDSKTRVKISIPVIVQSKAGIVQYLTWLKGQTDGFRSRLEEWKCRIFALEQD